MVKHGIVRITDVNDKRVPVSTQHEQLYDLLRIDAKMD